MSIAMEDYLKVPGLCSLGQLPEEMSCRPSPPLWLLTFDLILPTPGPQNVYYTSSQQIHVGILSPTVDDDDNRCLVDVNSRPRLIECSYARAKRMKLHWQFSQVAAPEGAARGAREGPGLGGVGGMEGESRGADLRI